MWLPSLKVCVPALGELRHHWGRAMGFAKGGPAPHALCQVPVCVLKAQDGSGNSSRLWEPQASPTPRVGGAEAAAAGRVQARGEAAVGVPEPGKGAFSCCPPVPVAGCEAPTALPP